MSALVIIGGKRNTLSKKKKRIRYTLHKPPRVFFTLSAVRLLKDALYLFEEGILRTTDHLPNISFAEEVIDRLKIKLDDMMQREEWERETPFDYNEIHILYASTHMYLVSLKFSGKENLRPACITLCKQFGRMVEYAEVKYIEAQDAPRDRRE